jgi:hypothetical protein
MGTRVWQGVCLLLSWYRLLRNRRRPWSRDARSGPIHLRTTEGAAQHASGFVRWIGLVVAKQN